MGADADAQRRKWDARWRAASGDRSPPRVLTDWEHLLPARGEALDLACGLGAGALHLARRGLRVTAWDLSTVAVERLRAAAATEGLAVRAEARDVVASPPPPAAFDVVLVARFLERALAPALAAALRPGGLLLYQTFLRERVDATGPPDDRYRLGRNELLRLFPDLVVRAYREEGTLGDRSRGLRNEALLVAEAPRASPGDVGTA